MLDYDFVWLLDRIVKIYELTDVADTSYYTKEYNEKIFKIARDLYNAGRTK